MGSNPDALYTYENFLDGLKISGNFACLPMPHILLVPLTKTGEIDDIKNVAHVSDTIAIKEMDISAEAEFKKRLTGLLDDLQKLQYFKEIST